MGGHIVPPPILLRYAGRPYWKGLSKIISQMIPLDPIKTDLITSNPILYDLISYDSI